MMGKRKISIYRDDVWAGDGYLENGAIVACPAVLGEDQDASEETYEAIEDAIINGNESVTRPDGIYSWIIQESKLTLNVDDEE